MKLITSALLFMLFIQTLAPCQNQRTTSLRGKVYATHFGALLSDIEIKLLRDERTIKITRTDKEGNYWIRDIPAGDYSIFIEELGFVTGRLKANLAEGEQKILDIALETGDPVTYATPPEFNISGTVTQPDGKAVARASVVVVSPFNNNRMAEAGTNEQGRYTLPAKEGQFLVYASGLGFRVKCASVLLRVISTPEQKTINFVLELLEPK